MKTKQYIKTITAQSTGATGVINIVIDGTKWTLNIFTHSSSGSTATGLHEAINLAEDWFNRRENEKAIAEAAYEAVAICNGFRLV